MNNQEITKVTPNGKNQTAGPEQVSKIVAESMHLDGQSLSHLAAVSEDQLETMRPVLCLFFGGSGLLMALFLTVILTARFGDAWRKKIRLLAFDTTEEPHAVQLGDQLIRLEPGSEFFNIGNVPVASILRNLDQHPSIKQRLGPAIKKLPSMAMRNGASSNRILGLLAFYWHFPVIRREIRRALWSLARRDQQSAETAREQQGLNIFIAGSLVGGTGSGILQDAAALTRSLVDGLGAQAEFCHITGIGILPQAFQDLNVPNIYPNTGAVLKELNHLMTYGGFETVYPDGRQIKLQEAPFDLFYVLDGVDERGQTWAGIVDVVVMAAEGIYLQMASQLGRRGDNAFDNVKDILMNRTPDGDGTFLASFGLGALEFPALAVADLCAHWLLTSLIKQDWLQKPEDKQVAVLASNQLQPAAPAHLKPVLIQDPASGSELRLDLRQPGWLQQTPAGEVAAKATRYVAEYGHARVNEKLLRQIAQNGQSQSNQQQDAWTAWVNDNLFAPGTSLTTISAVLQQAQNQLVIWAADSQGDLVKLDKAHESQVVTVAQAKSSLSEAADSLPFGRGKRIRKALDKFFDAAKVLYDLEIRQGRIRAQLRVWNDLAEYLGRLANNVQSLTGRLETLAGRLEVAAAEKLEAVGDNGISRLSLADADYVRELYHRHLPSQVNLMALAHFGQISEDFTPLTLTDLPTNQLSEQLLAALIEVFVPIRQLNVETVISERAGEMAPRARRQQLFQLATPSWSIDRTRLPEGGAQMVRIEVMGVPDSRDTLFEDELTLVSTHDPYRLVALVVVAGAPQSALQQYDDYQEGLEEALGYKQMHILPQFVADATQARLAFALGYIFGLIGNRGAHFYYQPADKLSSPIRLGNGLANAVEALESKEELAREIAERVDGQIARLGLEQAIETLADYYNVVPEGKSPLDEQTRELKQLVRAYADELHQIREFSSGMVG